jgi:putative FmdB family regulatory protein
VLADLKEAAAVPTYQYSCTECGHFFEQFQSFSEDSLTTCPQCEGRLRKVFNAVGVVFKGSGFYRTDSRSSSSSTDGGGSSSSDSSTSSGSDKGSDKSSDKGSAKGGAKSDSSAGSTSASSKAGSAA